MASNPRTNTPDYAALITQIQDTESGPLDLDAVVAALEHTARLQASTDELSSDFRILHDDYIARISGMLKAIAAVDRKRNRHAQALEAIERLEHLSADELIAQYRRVSAQFRDAFPTSWGLPSRLRQN